MHQFILWSIPAVDEFGVRFVAPGELF